MALFPSLTKPRRFFAFVTLMILATEGGAQVTTSNLGSGVSWFYEVKTDNWVGQAFTTDANSYTLDSVTLQLGTPTATGGNFSVSIFSNNSNNPGGLLETLSGSASPDGASAYTFTSSGLTLTANNTYHVIASVTTGTANYSWQNTDTTTESGPWVFPNYITLSTNQGGNWAQAGTQLLMSVSATPIPEPSTYAVLCGALALGVVAWRRRSGG